jgi:hypothetical protein
MTLGTDGLLLESAAIVGFGNCGSIVWASVGAVTVMGMVAGVPVVCHSLLTRGADGLTADSGSVVQPTTFIAMQRRIASKGALITDWRRGKRLVDIVYLLMSHPVFSEPT